MDSTDNSISDNDPPISDPESRVPDDESRFSDHESRISNDESRITNHESQITSHESRLTTHDSQLTAHESQLTAHGSRLTTHGSSGVIFDIQELSLQDGEGIRTSVFFKGCPLLCAWCSNPEGQSFQPELLCFFSRLKNVENFETLCDKNAISKDENGCPVFRKEICNSCRSHVCIENCMNEELRLAGRKISAHDLYEKVRQYSVFYENSNGGVTLTGGEPLAQPAFAKEFVNLCVSGGISVGLETCGSFIWSEVKDFIHKFDFIFFDIKHTDPAKHERLTGRSNKHIIENLERLAGIMPEKITVSIPLIENINISEEIITAIARLCSRLRITKARLLPYHTMGLPKYEALSRPYTLNTASTPSPSKINSLKSIFTSHNITCTT